MKPSYVEARARNAGLEAAALLTEVLFAVCRGDIGFWDAHYAALCAYEKLHVDNCMRAAPSDEYAVPATPQGGTDG